MRQSQPNYRIYPSLLDKFQELLDSELEADEFFNLDEEGNQKRSADEIADQHTQELLDTINRVPHDPIEAADKGTCFNEIVDAIGDDRDCAYPGMNWVPLAADGGLGPVVGLRASLNGFTFDFDINLLRSAADYFAGAVRQQLVKAMLTTRYGTVELYGYIDEILPTKVCDIKTTSSSYAFGKYERKWQKDVYPYCLRESGLMDVTLFEYTVYQLSKPSGRSPLITGRQYPEQYTYDHTAATMRLRRHVEHFIEWLEVHRDQITDRKIFGGDSKTQAA